MTGSHFNLAAFCAALDAIRMSKGLTWRALAQQAGVSPSTVTRMNQGKRPDVDGLAALCVWSGLTNLRPFLVGGIAAPEGVEEAHMVFFPLRPDSRCEPSIFLDRDRAHEYGRHTAGVVCAVPVVADYREVS